MSPKIWSETKLILLIFFFSDFWDGFTRSRLKFNPMQSISEASAVNWNYREGMKKKNHSLEKERTGFKIITGKYPAVT